MIESRPYSFDAKLKIWVTPTHDGTSYSDGDAVEHRLLSALQHCQNVSASSEELRTHIIDWPSEYHLSPTRHNLLRPFTLGPSHHILELGCGCGAITRYLGETGAKVVAVEGSRRRAAIAAERCRDLPNVTVYCDNLVDFQRNEDFNFVTLIGVLEYSRQFIIGLDPVRSCLEKAGSFLSEDGMLVLAIENQLGLKYFNGCSEDHTGAPYYGINDLYGTNTPVTFGREELKAHLHVAGFADLSFLYPFPDYKLADVILSEEAFNHPDFRTADILSRSFSRDYGGGGYRAFHENLAWQPLARNRLVQDLANSFLVMAHKTRAANRPPSEWLARIYSTGRLPSFAIETVFVTKGDAIAVAKHKLLSEMMPPDSMEGSRFFHHPPLHAAYVPGHLYSAELQPIMARGEGPIAVARWAAPWVNRLVAEALPGSENAMMLRGSRLDAIPTNLVRDRSGLLVDIDLEWSAATPVPLAWVLIRGLVNSLATCPLSPAFAGLSFRDGVSKILEQLGQELTDNDYRIASEFEDALQVTVFGPRQTARSFSERLAGPMYSSATCPTFHQEITDLQKEIARVKSTFSWRITKPLRFIWNTVLQKLITRVPKP